MSDNKNQQITNEAEIELEPVRELNENELDNIAGGFSINYFESIVKRKNS